MPFLMPFCSTGAVLSKIMLFGHSVTIMARSHPLLRHVLRFRSRPTRLTPVWLVVVQHSAAEEICGDGEPSSNSFHPRIIISWRHFVASFRGVCVLSWSFYGLATAFTA